MRNFWDLKVLILSCTFQLSQSVSEKQSENQSVSRKIDADNKPLAKQKVMITLNDLDDDNAKYFLSAALKLFIMYSDWQAFMVRSVYRIEFDIRFNSFSHMCVFTWKNSWMFRTA